MNATVIDRCHPAASFPKILEGNILLQKFQAFFGRFSYGNAIFCYVVTR
jgi:hypothetical protein